LSKSTLKQEDQNSIELRNAGLRVTQPRMAVLAILQEADPHHLSAEDVHRRLVRMDSSIGLTTVYRVLSQLEQHGFVTRHHFDGSQAVFELDQGDAHHHIVCTETGVVAEFRDERIEKRLEAIARELGFELTDHQIVIKGVYTENDAGREQEAGRPARARKKKSRF